MKNKESDMISKQIANQSRWQRIILLVVLGYEAAGALSGGFLLTLAPDGSLMKMPVDIMHGFFKDFFIPGLMLVGLGIINAAAFVAVLLKKPNGWIFSGLALGGLAVWFIVEIIVLREFHWLHAMWGIPVILGCVMIKR